MVCRRFTGRADDYQYGSVYAIELTLRGEELKLISMSNIQSELEEKEMEAWQNLVRVLTHEIMNSVTPISSLAGIVEEDLKQKLEKGTEVKLTIKRVDGTIKVISLIRDEIKLEDTYAKSAVIGGDHKVGYIYLPEFYANYDDPNGAKCSEDVAKEIRKLKDENVEGVILDLRGNGGGSLAEAIDLTGLFIKEGAVVQVKNSAGKVEIGQDDDKQVVYSGPLVVLTNRFSASASEIFAGAIQDYQRGVIVGESTYGKGTVQQVLDLKRFISDKDEVGELKWTFQKFYRVTGSSTQNKGVIPDI